MQMKPHDRSADRASGIFLFAAYAGLVICCATQAMAQGATSTSFSVSPIPPVATGTAVTLTATVRSGGHAVTPGQVTFCEANTPHCEDMAVLGVAQLNRNGQASATLVLSAGQHSIKAVFAGTQTYIASASQPQTIAITGLSSTTVTISAARLSTGTYSLTAKLVANGPEPPLGAVSFLDASNKNAAVASAALSSSTFSNTFHTDTGLLFPVGDLPDYVTVADVNSDGVPDMIVANALDHTVTVFLGVGDGKFTRAAGSPITVGNYPVSIAVADFNGDGIADLAVANFGSNTVTVLRGNGSGGFTQFRGSPVAAGFSPQSVTVGDFNSDGIPDLAVADFTGNNVTVLLGDGTGLFAADPGSPFPVGSRPVSVAAADFNGDGTTDLAVVNQSSNSVTVLLGDGFGGFSQAPGSPFATGSHPISVVAGDVNRDGSPDLIVANYNSKTLSIFVNDRSAVFTQSVNSPVGVGGNPEQVVTGDFNGDGILDVATANLQGTTSLLRGNGQGKFTLAPGSPLAVSTRASSLAVADFNADGVTDLAVANLNDNNVRVLLGQLTQTATAIANNVKLIGSGAHSVFASYPGDTNYGASESRNISLGASELFLSPYSLSFGSALLGSTSSPRTVTITNNGKSTINIGSVLVSGNNPLSFSSTDTCSAPLLAGKNCIIQVSFRPQGTGAQSAEIDIFDDASNSPQVVPVSGVGAATTISISPASLNFGGVESGNHSNAQSLTLTNTGNAPLAISNIAITGVGAASFSSSNNCGSTLAVHASCGIQVQFQPQATGILKATVLITDNGVGSPQQAGLAGIGLSPTPGVRLSTSALRFGTVVVGSNSPTSAVTLTNVGVAALTISKIALTGTDPQDFAEANTCGTSLGSGKSCSISVLFRPTQAGSRAALVEVSDNASGSPQILLVTGTGETSGPSAALSPTSLSFPATAVANLSAPQNVVLKNSGNGVLTISGISFTGAAAGSYLQTNNCELRVAPGASCTITVTFKPRATGSLHASLNIADNAPNSPQTVALSGTGIAVSVSLSATALNFPVTAVGSVSEAQQVVVKNSGNVPVSISAIALTGVNSLSFVQLSTCGSTVAVGSSCTILVAMAPTTSGLLNATLEIVDGAANSPQTVALSGTGR